MTDKNEDPLEQGLKQQAIRLDNAFSQIEQLKSQLTSSLAELAKIILGLRRQPRLS